MKKLSEPKDKQDLMREAIIGLGEASFKKNYYPELQKKITDLENLNTRYKALIETVPDILLVSNPDGIISRFVSISPEDNEIAQAIMSNADVRNKLESTASEAFKTRYLITYNFVLSYQETIHYFEARINASGNEEVLIIIRDMTQRTLLEKKLRDSAEKDTLTKIYNRQYFEDRMSEFDGQFAENFAVILLDVDGLKIINDTLGHLRGDELLLKTAHLITSHFNPYGLVSRVGGDEFGIVLTGCSQPEIEKLLRLMDTRIIELNEYEETLKISLSSGYSYCKNEIINVKNMYQEADNKMYQNKLLKEASGHSGIVKALMKALEAKDYITEGHATRMEQQAIRLGLSMNLSKNQMDRIKLLAKFHDIGKVGIPDIILQKPSSLSEEEWVIMKTHSSIGKRIADASSELRGISELILLHHERWDGKGYPLGIRGTSIPVECRILSIVDAFDAMTNDRLYRQAFPPSEAIEQIKKCAGTQFDAELVNIFCMDYEASKLKY